MNLPIIFLNSLIRNFSEKKRFIILIFDTVERKKMKLTYLDGCQGMSEFIKKKIRL